MAQLVNNFSSAERPGTSKRLSLDRCDLSRRRRPRASTSAAVASRSREEVEGACASQSGEGLLNKDN
jgi:hypothetical protein